MLVDLFGEVNKYDEPDSCSHAKGECLVHIVYLGHNNGLSPSLTSRSHLQLLSRVFMKPDEAKQAILYSYSCGFSGFAALLNSTQASTLSETEGVISVFRSRILEVHTTRSWDFMGLNLHMQMEQSSQMHLKFGDDVIVGVLDTGVWPESESFRDDPHYGPIPSSWRGTCVKGDSFDPATACNRKLIGARYYLAGIESELGPLDTSGGAEYRSPRDRVGHGTHTASTAVGSVAPNASYFGLGRGAARGGAPRARLAVYKVCWYKDLTGRCSDADILAAFDDALCDGVHVVSASLGSSPPLMPLFATSTEVGAFHAMQRGVVTVFSAGNDGPDASMVQNVSPWGLTVAASTIDRRFPTVITLGNNASIVGESFLVKDMKKRLVESSSVFTDGTCAFEQLINRTAATGKIVLCFGTMGMVSSEGAALAVYAGNGDGVIFANTISRKSSQDNFWPTVHVDLHQGTQILYYIRASRNAMVHISPSKTVVGKTPAPTVAYFSSRGPSSITPNILKPDVTAPGVNILAAWPPKSSPTVLPLDKRSTNWNFDSGTSMSCPHVSGIAALIKSVHPTWSPAAVKSALMTTAYMYDDTSDVMLAGGTLKAADAFDVGAGHVHPLRALDPGLVYDAGARDHVLFLCSLGYTAAQIRQMVLPGSSLDTSCPGGGAAHAADLNYPAIVLPDLSAPVTVKRTVTNVGANRGAVYRATVVSPQGARAEVWPPELAFSPHHGDTASYYVSVTPAKPSRGRFDFGEIVWSDGFHRVRTPLVVRVTNLPDDGVRAAAATGDHDSHGTTDYLQAAA
ncbi:subtilisin-like protease SBT3.18 isoform X3 [Panicum virgatum]|uniref:subtilisin-like protease SBT3.18 isoform X3 n=1 Tax=Panicum virgatum TaxID=38727 RepID=UPI0019D59751|nr:subtilisin-like protease SBT3.18 isoform X3 [Panicum virgatum]XP_039779892.1 subtilisin-like protease SBT3.18 isoform X3 [Panicum virgatum]